MSRYFVLALFLTQLSHMILASGSALGQSSPQQSTQELNLRIDRLMKLLADKDVAGALAEGESLAAFAKAGFGENSEAHGAALSLFALALYTDYMGNMRDARRRGRMADMAERANSIMERLNAPPDKIAFLGGLMWVDRLAAGRYEEVVKLAERLLPYSNKVEQVTYLTWNVFALVQLGRMAEAEAAGRRAVDLAEQLDHSQQIPLAEAIDKLAWVYEAQSRLVEAERLFLRSMAIRERHQAAEPVGYGRGVASLANNYRLQGRFSEALATYNQAITIFEQAGPAGAAALSQVYNHLGVLSFQLRQFQDAQRHYARALPLMQSLLGPDHPDISIIYSNIGQVLRELKQFAEAERHFRDALGLREKTFGREHEQVALVLHKLGRLRQDQGAWAEALSFFKDAAEIRIRLQNRKSDRTQSVSLVSGQEPLRDTLLGVVQSAWRAIDNQKDRRPGLMNHAFIFAQSAGRAAVSGTVAQMAARLARGDTALAGLVRQRQDLVSSYNGLEERLTAAFSLPEAQRDRAKEAGWRAEVDAVRNQLRTIDAQLERAFPEYHSLANPESLSVAALQRLLHEDEALILFLDTAESNRQDDETYVWVVTKTDAQWVRSVLGTKGLTEQVGLLRCGLDRASWDSGSNRCATLLASQSSNAPGSHLPFDLAASHALYLALFGEVDELIRDKRLLVVPSGPLSALPFQVLVTQKPAVAIPASAGDYAHAAWLGRRQPITVLPSVSSLRALREFAKASTATQPFIGFGNPLLIGPDRNDRRAWERQSCGPPSGLTQVASRRVRSAIPKFFRSGLANVEEVRTQHPLPETTDELCAVAKATGSVSSAVYLGERATESVIKQLSANGTLAQARVVHFATHGLVAAETETLASDHAEPALILTPPEQASEENDGLLTASEIAQLKMDADWVVLSACNTAAGENDKPDAEALSGLARAFFYSGARALLVSHWAVNSDATVRLITKAFDELSANPKAGRAEALRRSMQTLMSEPDYAHPALWAPFVVVGEGAR